jgi:hypothetical protein
LTALRPLSLWQRGSRLKLVAMAVQNQRLGVPPMGADDDATGKIADFEPIIIIASDLDAQLVARLQRDDCTFWLEGDVAPRAFEASDHELERMFARIAHRVNLQESASAHP